MRLEQSNGGASSPLLSPRCIVTYKRRKRDKLLASKATSTPPLSARNQTHELDSQARIVRHWRHVLEQIAHSLDLRCISGVHSCIKTALSCDPLQSSSNLNIQVRKDRHELHLKKCLMQGDNSFFDETLTPALEKKQVILNGPSNFGEDQLDVEAITKKCQNVLLNLLVSQKFALLCDLLCESFQPSKAKVILDLSLIISKLNNGVYKRSSKLFYQDIQQVWQKYQKIGEEMALLACNLSNISRTSFLKQGACQNAVESASVNVHTASQFTCYNTEVCTNPEENDLSYLDKVSTCKECSTEARGRSSLICDGCELMYHITCVKPAVQSIPKRSWYCAACANKRESAEPDLSPYHLDCQHQNCLVCRRLEDLGYHGNWENHVEVPAISNSRESSVSSMEIEESPKLSRTALLHLCKQCGTSGDEGRKFLVCSNSECLFKYYHVQCLKSSQVANEHQAPNCWYCPSCLCRACLTDRDDALICICDGCDEGYHTYCMKPPRVSIPVGQWYCFNCNLARAKKGMRLYEQSLLQKHGKGELEPANGVSNSMDMLRTEETIVKAIGKNR